jgi:hypothetical protein
MELSNTEAKIVQQLQGKRAATMSELRERFEVSHMTALALACRQKQSATNERLRKHVPNLL